MREVVAKSWGIGAQPLALATVVASVLAWGGLGIGSAWGAPQLFPTVELVDIDESEGVAIFSGEVPEGFRHLVLEVEPAGDLESAWIPMVAGPLTGARASVLVRCPIGESERRFFRLKVGTETEVPMAAVSGPEYLSVSYADAGNYVAANLEAGHVLNRVAYGPSADDLAWVESAGVPAYLEAQLDPGSIDESGNGELNLASAALFIDYLSGGEGSALVSPGDGCRFFRGVSEPPVGWAAPGFDDSGWESGVTGLGYGDGDDETVLEDMQGNYASVYVRQEFEVADPAAIEVLLLDIRYDDAFVAYINGVEVARSSNIAGSPPAFDATASPGGGSVDDPEEFPSQFNVTAAAAPVLVAGTNTLAVQGHNASLGGSSDFSIIPGLFTAAAPPFQAIRSKAALQQLLHLRGIYSRRQLQAVLGEFWENHFTTDYDKVQDYLEELDAYEEIAGRSEADEDRIYAQTRWEAATIEWEEYEFFYNNALGHFGDLLLYSATSPSMLIYLDNVLNRIGNPNENYAREILELSAFGVDNRYTQLDLEQLARCFTGWTVRKVQPEHKPGFPDSARNPLTGGSQEIDTAEVIVGEGDTWRFFRGTAEPSPGAGGVPTADWAAPGFDDSGWESGPTGIGYGDGDDATVLEDMAGNYVSVYLRTEVVLPDPSEVGDLVVSVRYDDGVVVYLNGTEIGRSRTLYETGEPPAFDVGSDSHEVTGDPLWISLREFGDLINVGGSNTLAIQGHNTGPGSSDFSVIPEVLAVTLTPESIDEASPLGQWVFRFNPENHDTGAKTIFAGTPYEINIPEGRTGQDGVNDALDVIDLMESHPSTAEFICIKLVNRFVSDGISLDTYHDRSAPEHLLGLVDDAIHAWHSTARPGHIGTVLRTILDPTFHNSAFWTEGAFLTKVKTPIEYVNSVVRALGATVVDDDLRDRIADQAMSFFDRDEPDGYSELASAWVDTLSLLERMRFCQATSSNLSAGATFWDVEEFLVEHGLAASAGSPDEIENLLDYFDQNFFLGNLTPERRAVVLDFANSNDTGEPGSSPFSGLSGGARRDRLEETVGLILSAPEFHYQ